MRATSALRIIGGALAGRRLSSPRGERTRPTSSRAREGLFGWLGPLEKSTRVLDLFAGTGSLGLEALSRGAQHALFVERDPAALRCLRQNVRDLDLGSRATLIDSEAVRAVRRMAYQERRFDLILADPPYESAPELSALPLHALLSPGGALVVERRSRRRGPSGAAHEICGLHRIESRSYGQTAFDWYAHGPELDPEAEQEEIR